MKKLIFILIFLLPTLAFAGDVIFVQPGASTTYGSDGSMYMHQGNTTYGSDGSMYMHQGNTTYGSDGSMQMRQGNTVYDSDGNMYFSE